MKVAYFGYDPLHSCLDVFLKLGHQFTVIYTGERSVYTQEVIRFSQKNDIRLCFGKPSLSEMQALVKQGVELFFSAEYPWKIPVPTDLKYAINLHPTLLPEGRGMTPLPHLILKESAFAGITLHKLSNEFDTGDILLQKPITLDKNETFDSLSRKVFEQTPDLLFSLLSELNDYYHKDQAQGEGSYWPAITKDEQTLDWQQSTSELLTRLRAFGSLGTYADIERKACVIAPSASPSALVADGGCYQHDYRAGQVILTGEQYTSIATIDGELCIPNQWILLAAIP